jgi:hypothetical protein
MRKSRSRSWQSLGLPALALLISLVFTRGSILNHIQTDRQSAIFCLVSDYYTFQCCLVADKENKKKDNNSAAW